MGKEKRDTGMAGQWSSQKTLYLSTEPIVSYRNSLQCPKTIIIVISKITDHRSS